MRCWPNGLKIMLPKPEPAIAMPMTRPLFLMNQLFMMMETVVELTVIAPAPMQKPQIQNCQASWHWESMPNETAIRAAPHVANSRGLIFV